MSGTSYSNYTVYEINVKSNKDKVISKQGARTETE